jgi:hypothetical protein
MTRRSNNSLPVPLSVAKPEASGSSTINFANVENRGELTGYLKPPEQGWINDDLIEDTRRVWSKQYGRLIAAEEAVEILVNVKKVAEAFMKAMRRPTE